jgi:FtsZ-binding cell division protein ZapB
MKDQPREWTQELVRTWSYKFITLAHNAALAAVELDRDGWIKAAENAGKELAAEQIETRQAHEVVQIRDKEIEELKRANRGLYIESNERYQRVKTLVEALEKLRSSFPFNDNAATLIDAALAKAKEL